MKKLMQHFVNNTDISKKILLLFVFFCVIPMTLSFIITVGCVAPLSGRNLERSIEQSMDQTVLLIQSRLDALRTTSEAVIMDRNLKEQLDNLYDNTYPLAQQTRDYENLTEFFRNLERSDSIYSIRIYLPDSITYAKEGVHYCALAEYAGWEDVAGVQYRIDDSFAHAEKETRVVSLVRPLRNPYDYSQTAAILKVSTRYDDVLQIIRDQGAAVEGGVAYIRNADGAVLCGSSPEIAATPVTGTHDTWLDVLLAGKRGRIIERPIADAGWTVGCFVPYSTVIFIMAGQALGMFFIIGFIAICAYFIARLLSKQSKKRIDAITAHMKEIQRGDLSVTIDDKGQDDIGIIVNHFNIMVRCLDATLKRKEETDRKLAEAQSNYVRAELLALQSQINPHFLYNILDFINWVAISRNLPELEEMVELLSVFYRQSLGKAGSMVTLESELRHVESYTRIQNLRFGGQVALIGDIDQVRDCRLPRITLQPLVENCFVHGFKNLGAGKGVIAITGHLQDGRVVVTITDNGLGMSREQIERANRRQYASIGIKNVNTRLVLSFGEAYGLRYETVETGTRAVLEFPAVYQEGL